jgi:prevent-host-death family protein
MLAMLPQGPAGGADRGRIAAGSHPAIPRDHCAFGYWPKLSSSNTGNRMKTLTAKDAKYGFGRLIDLARAEPVAVAKHGRPVVVMMAVEEFERLKALDAPATISAAKRRAGT